MLDFNDLCNKPLAAADYIALAENFSTLALADVPLFGAANISAAYRFVTLIDVLYEHRWVQAC
jgi:predicted ATPase